MRRARLSTADGFSLLEALLAASLLAAGVLSLVQLFLVGIRATSTTRQTTVATILATQKIEELRSGPLPMIGGGTDRVAEYTRRWEVSPYDADPVGTQVIRVSVTPGDVVVATLRTRTVP